MGPETFRALSEIDPEHLALHFRGKVHGALGLDAALRARQGPPPDFCILLSSLASVLGGLAYGAYAAANHFLDAWAQSPAVDPPTASTWAWQSVGWDVWEFEDESEQITALRPDLAQLAMTPRQGELALLRVLRFDVEHVLVSTADLATRLAERRRRIAAHGTPAATTTARARHVRPELQTPYLAPSNELERQIVEIWQEFLGFETIGTNDNFFELGGDSFIAVRVAARLREALQVELPVAQLFQRLTIRSLAEFLAQDTASADAERAAHLADRRESMKRRQNILERRRARKKR